MIYVLIFIIGQFFIGPNQTYSILLNDDLKLVKIDTLNENEVLFSFVGVKNNINYSYTVISTSSTKKNLLLQSTIEDYEADCQCQVIKKEIVILNNFKAAKYTIEKEAEGISLKGYSYISLQKNGTSLNVVSLAEESTFDQLEALILPMLNSTVLNF